MAAGCLHHPLAHLVIDARPADRAELELAIETALTGAELSEEEAAAFRERAIAATRVVRTSAGTYTFEQPERPLRRQQAYANDLTGTLVRSIAVGLAVAAIVFVWPAIVALVP